jgi:hypothetical protein
MLIAAGCKNDEPPPQGDPAAPSAAAAPHDQAPAAAEPPAAEPPAGWEGPGHLDLPEDLRELLVTEMRSIEGGMQALVPHLVQGHMDEVAALGRQIHDSFVLAQQITPEQRARLVELLPDEFRTMDRAFHRLGADLAEAAARGDAREASRVYGALVDGCVRCHQAYARTRFPGLVTPAP